MTILIIAGAVALGACSQRASGMGMGIVGGPIVSLVLGPATGILVINVIACVNAIILTWGARREVSWKRFGLIASMLIVGAIPGAWLVRSANPALLQVLVGLAVLAALGLVTWGARLVPTPRGPVPALCAGAIGGFMNTLAGVAGPAITVYAQAARWPHVMYAATLQPIFMVSGLLSVVVKTVGGAGSLADVSLWLWPAAAVGMVAGIAAGRAVAGRITHAVAHRAALTLAVAGAGAVVVRGALAWWAGV
nr:sulfite exporter TauE/SafE family protein [Corynebacterium sp. c6VSa_13]